MMKVLVIGLGSMGKRRIRLLKSMEGVMVCGIDSNPDRRKEVNELFNVECFASLDEALVYQPFDSVVISTSPLAHASLVKECLNKGLHVFTELNLVSTGYDENIRLSKEKRLVLFMSSTQMYRKEVKSIINTVQDSPCHLNYIYHIGQYLPDWHPWESYNKYFVGDARTNGCREIMAIELPWLITAFGKVNSFSLLKSKNTKLNIDYNDNYLILLEHEGGHKGCLAVDVVTRKATRYIDVYGENLHLYWNPSTDKLVKYDYVTKKDVVIANEESMHQDGYASFVNETPYLNELKAFFECINNPGTKPVWDYEKDKYVLDLIDKIEGYDSI